MKLAKKEKDEILRYFNEQVAMTIGVYEAIIIQQIEYWVKANEKKKINLHDGYYWTFNSIEEWSLQFPFWCEKTTKRLLKKLRDQEYLITTNEYNHRKGDKTLWYRINYDKLNQLSRDSLTPSPIIKNPSDIVEPKGQVDPNQQDSLTPTQGQVGPITGDSLTPTLPIVTNSYEITTNSYEVEKKKEEKEYVQAVIRQYDEQEFITLDGSLHPGFRIWEMKYKSTYKQRSGAPPVVKIKKVDLPEILEKLEKLWPTCQGQPLINAMNDYLSEQKLSQCEPNILDCINGILNKDEIETEPAMTVSC